MANGKNLRNRKSTKANTDAQGSEPSVDDIEPHDPSTPSKSKSQSSTAASPSRSNSKKSPSKHGKHHSNNKELKKSLYQSRRATFFLGAILGLLATIFLTTYASEDLRSELDKLMTFDSFNDFFEDWKDSMPAPIQLMLDKTEKPSSNDLKGSAESFSVGLRLKGELNLTAKHNVVMVPGVISTGLESWGVSEDGDCPSLPHFRKRLWGSFYMLRTMILDKACWLKHIKLDPTSGLDPPGVKLRASLGFDGADFFVAGYWIWNKILQNLAVVGYGPENMISAGYDWRLAYLDLEKRDGYFTKLKLQIESTKRLTGEKSYLVGHSMGSQVIIYFLKWAEAKGEFYGNGGPNWCEEHISGFINISGSLLGTPKTITALLSGEMKDTVQLNYLAMYGLEKFLSKRERVEMIRTFGGVPSMIPKGGDAVWGNLTNSPDDPSNTLQTDVSDENIKGPKDETFGKFLRYRSRNGKINPETGIDLMSRDFTMMESIDKLLDVSPDWFLKRIEDNYSFGLAETKEELAKNNHDHLKWSNPLEVSLPNAPSMKIFCFYGVGNPTERAYTYKEGDNESKLPFIIDTESAEPVFFGDGDGTVSLLTHSVCHEWKKPNSRFNPASIPVKIVEIKHEPDRFDIRGGAKTAEHVDILGSAELNELILKVVTGRDELIEDAFYSELKNITAQMSI